jgi:hypothetical protein
MNNPSQKSDSLESESKETIDSSPSIENPNMSIPNQDSKIIESSQPMDNLPVEEPSEPSISETSTTNIQAEQQEQIDSNTPTTIPLQQEELLPPGTPQSNNDSVLDRSPNETISESIPKSEDPEGISFDDSENKPKDESRQDESDDTNSVVSDTENLYNEQGILDCVKIDQLITDIISDFNMKFEKKEYKIQYDPENDFKMRDGEIYTYIIDDMLTKQFGYMYDTTGQTYKIKICAYKINTTSKKPFLQFLLRSGDFIEYSYKSKLDVSLNTDEFDEHDDFITSLNEPLKQIIGENTAEIKGGMNYQGQLNSGIQPQTVNEQPYGQQTGSLQFMQQDPSQKTNQSIIDQPLQGLGIPSQFSQQQQPLSGLGIQQQQPPSGLGIQQPSSGLGIQQQPPPSEYGQQPSSGLGIQQQPPPSEYGQQPPPSEYGQQPPPSEYGQQPSSGLGIQQQPPPSEYGQPPSSEYGQPPPSEYGQPPPSGFGMPSLSEQSGFEQQQSGFGISLPSEFGQSQSSFGMPPPSGFEQQPPSGFGISLPSEFGQSQSSFGMPPSLEQPDFDIKTAFKGIIPYYPDNIVYVIIDLTKTELSKTNKDIKWTTISEIEESSKNINQFLIENPFMKIIHNAYLIPIPIPKAYYLCKLNESSNDYENILIDDASSSSYLIPRTYINDKGNYFLFSKKSILSTSNTDELLKGLVFIDETDKTVILEDATFTIGTQRFDPPYIFNTFQKQSTEYVFVKQFDSFLLTLYLE